MNKKIFNSVAVAALMVAGLTSCSEESSMAPQMPDVSTEGFVYAPDDSWSQFKLTTSAPEEELRSRAFGTSEVTVGADGLWTFNQHIEDCDLWYAVYEQLSNGNKQLLFDSSTSGAPKPVRDKNDNSKWSLVYSLPKSVDIESIYIYLYAGHKTYTHVIGKSGVINNSASPDAEVRFTTAELELKPNGRQPHTDGYFYNGFYYCGKAIGGASATTTEITLKRPWAEVHVLTDEFYRNGDIAKIWYPNGLFSRMGMSTDGAYSAWNSRISDLYFKVEGTSAKQNGADTPLCSYNNTLNASQWERVTFDGRKMDYLGCYHVPHTIVNASAWGNGIIANNNNPYISINKKAWTTAADMKANDVINVQLPTTTFNENTRYIFYNKKLNDGDTEAPGEGMLTNNWTYTIVAGTGWDSSNNKPY